MKEKKEEREEDPFLSQSIMAKVMEFLEAVENSIKCLNGFPAERLRSKHAQHTRLSQRSGDLGLVPLTPESPS